MWPRRLIPIVLVCAGWLATAPAAPFAPEVMNSVVSVLPVWPGYENRQTGPQKPGEEPEGTAVAIADGFHLVTSLHVVGRASRISVRLADGRKLPAQMVAGDRATDLAVLRIADPLPVLAVAPAPGLGQPVCAIGNQFGLGLSVTCGVISATRRSGTGFNPVEDFIQTDAAVNPGASGGALVDGKGRLVGILSAIFTKKSDANLGVNFAVSMALVRRVTIDLIAHGKVRRGRIGVRVGDLPRNETRPGALVRQVIAGGAAARAGLRAGDIVTAIDSGTNGPRAIRSASDVTAAVYLHRIGDEIQVTVWRDGAARNFTMRVGK